MSSMLVSVELITYNHVNFIKQAFDGVLMQQTKFPFEIVVGEDFSTDGTREVVYEYQKRYPEIVRVVTDTKNVGAMANVRRTLTACRGKYIAALEGDDFWTDPLKLQKQVDFLETHPEYACVHHPVNVLRELTNEHEVWNVESKDTISILDLAEHNKIITVSCVFRNQFEKTPDWVFELPIGDYPLHLFNAQFGLVKLLPEVMATYRIHNGGIYESKSEQRKLRMLIDTLNGLIGRFGEDVNFKLSAQQLWYLDTYAQKYDLEDFEYLPKAFIYMLSENKMLKRQTLDRSSIKGFVDFKWKNLQRKISKGNQERHR